MNTGGLVIILKWVLLAAVVAACNYFALRPLLDVAGHAVLLDSIFSGIVLIPLVWLLRRSVPESMASLGYLHRMLYYCAVGLLFVAVWLLAEAALLEIFSPGSVTGILPAAPVKILIGMLIYMSLLLAQHRAERDEIKEQVAAPVSETRAAAERPAEPVTHVSVRNGSKIELIDAADIIVLEADGDYVRIITGKGRFLKEQTMKYFTDNLSPDMFVRVHRSAIVNIKAISRIETYEKQKYIAVMRSGRQVRMSQGGYRLLKETMNL